MKKNIALICVLIFTVHAQQDPFHKAHELYHCSQWKEAQVAYEQAFAEIEKECVHVEEKGIIAGHVGYADVLWANAVEHWYEGHVEQAYNMWIKSAEHREYRLNDGQFGRVPLKKEEEWDGSNLSGKTIVVYSERNNGAFGDTFAMSHLLGYLKGKGAHVVFVPQKPLKAMYETEGTLQHAYIDQIVLRDQELPKHDAKIYLWSIFPHMLKDHCQKGESPFPIKPWISGQLQEEHKKKLQEYIDKGNMLIGFWYRSSANVAADNRYLERNPGAHRVLEMLQSIPQVTLVNFEGMGHYPISRRSFEELTEKGNLDELDVCEEDCDPSQVVQLSNNIPFIAAAALGEFIVKNNGVLVGCDTGLLNLFAGIKGNEDDKQYAYNKQSIFAILNAQADFRWGGKKEIEENGSVKPRIWYLSDRVKIFQAPKQGDFATPLKQIKKEIEERVKRQKENIEQSVCKKK